MVSDTQKLVLSFPCKYSAGIRCFFCSATPGRSKGNPGAGWCCCLYAEENLIKSIRDHGSLSFDGTYLILFLREKVNEEIGYNCKRGLRPD